MAVATVMIVVTVVVVFSGDALALESERGISDPVFDTYENHNLQESNDTASGIDIESVITFFSLCIKFSCPDSNINRADCPSVCSGNVDQFTDLLNSFQSCLNRSICGSDLNQKKIPDFVFPIAVRNYNGLCYLRGNNITVTNGNVINNRVKGVEDVPYYVDSLKIGPVTWNGLYINCRPFTQYPNQTYTDTNSEAFSGPLTADETIITDVVFNLTRGQEVPDIRSGKSEFYVDFESPDFIPSQYQDDVETSVTNALTSMTVDNEWAGLYKDFYEVMFNSYIMTTCNKCS